MTAHTTLLSPIDIAGLTVKNRLMLTTHNPKMSEARYLEYLRTRVTGGVGLVGIPVLSEAIATLSFVSTGKPEHIGIHDIDAGPDAESPEGIEYYDDLLLPRLRARAEIVHAAGAKVFGQIANRGSIRLPETFQAMVSPSGVVDPQVRAQSHVLTGDEVRRVVALFARCAARIKEGGFDGVEIHATHGYLVEQFLSPLTNLREDEYGGSAENRRRFLDEIIAATRATCGPDFPIGIRVSGQQAREGGMTPEDVGAVVAAVQPELAYVNVTAGTIMALDDGVALPYVASAYYQPGFNAPAAGVIKRSTDLPVILTGRVNDPDLMEGLLADGVVDMVGTTRSLIADPDFLRKVERGESGSIRKCIGINECHYPDRVSACPVNPWAGREDELALPMPKVGKHVVVVGGGPSGLMCARTAAERGHRVTLLERSDQLGGKVRTLMLDPSRAEFRTLIEDLESEVRGHGVDVRTGVEATPELIAELGADAVVAATGALPRVPDLPGLEETATYSALDILTADLSELGQRVLVIGGLNDHIAPLAAAEFLANAGKEVVVTSECVYPGQGAEPSILHELTRNLATKGVQVRPITRVASLGPAPRLVNTFSKQSEELAFDAVVFAAEQAVTPFPDLPGEFYRIGDAIAPRRIVHATLDGARTGVRL